VFANVNFSVCRNPIFSVEGFLELAIFPPIISAHVVFSINDDLVGITLNSQNMLPSVSTRFNIIE
jgi:hypothetical protein